MIDREKVIKGLELHLGLDSSCVDCPYFKCGSRCLETLQLDALELLKEQKEETTFVLGGYYEPTCEKCGFRSFAGYIPTIEWMKQHGYKRCPHCGRAVKWNETD